MILVTKPKAILFLKRITSFFLVEGINFSSTKRKINHPAINSKIPVIRNEFRKPKISAEIPPNKGPKKLPKKIPVCTNPKLNPIFFEGELADTKAVQAATVPVKAPY